MRLDKDKLARLAALPDEELWREVVAIAGGYGIRLSEKAPSHSEMQKMRTALSGGARLSIADAMRLVNEYKKGK